MMKKIIGTSALLILGGCASGTTETGATSTRFFQQADFGEPKGQIFMPEPPDSAKAKGIQVVRVARVDGKPVPKGTDRMIRLSPGPHEVSFMKPGHRREEIPVVMDIEDGKIYWCGWRPVDGHWEPVVYAIQDE